MQRAKNLVREAADTRVRSEYASLVRGLPALLHQSGLFQTIAYLESRSHRASNNPTHRLVLAHLASLLSPFTGMKELKTDELTQMNLHEYLIVSRLSLEAASWLKRMVEIQFGDEEEPHA
ncbi:type III-B CRISPR module-associated protein Cmr5 [Alicyclobacillus sendaiensis]|uniref:CRISPR type III-B/RAMP module-associated protein Cmr5 n=1 Tax=Alicyclobacillus sendaiensis PA2 TaxID=3029425 RepID=A0ABT6Y0X6_ALISE|nr:type III-B CRISPR module-associated protein Cmr5 [Alicyclobacillus sendaiensis]MDI9260995.1 type III-B CRISPR module-associated protein Cmr5 [Alicyclobacillus sendaiensis PA2]